MPSKSGPKWTIALAVSLMMMSLTSCSSGIGNDPGCAGWHPIYPSPADRMTPQTERQILTHDQSGAERCGWKP